MGLGSKRVAFHTLGCKVNQVETQALRDDFLQRGWQVMAFHEAADVYIVNSCTVTHVSDRKSRAMLRRAAARQPGALVVLVGCMAGTSLDDREIPEAVGLIIANRDKPRTAELVEQWLMQRSGRCEHYLLPPENGDHLEGQLHRHRYERSRAFLKIQDGCENFCSYCIVPYVRGPVRSKLPEEVLTELEQLLDLGYHEIVLTGIHTGHYGLDLPDWDLGRLLEFLLPRLPHYCRLRLSSIEPTDFHPRLVEILTGSSVICRHFHIPLQSGSDHILASMRRPYRRKDYITLIEQLDGARSGTAFTADVMVGYPGETESDFLDTHQLLLDLPISDLHVFKYSRRAGTVAAAMGQQLTAEQKAKRSQCLIELGRQQRRAFIDGQQGQQLEVVLEQFTTSDRWVGLSDNYIELLLEGLHVDAALPGELRTTVLEGLDPSGQLGRGRILDNWD